ncbi:MAG: hypothetical protein HY209_05625 [Candidatus Omnitrophica bacterium]|nr:hypothetical protein [Candidatus Omnitrophota bacterium]
MSSKKTFLLLTVFAAILFGGPHLGFQDNLAQGDHGRDLYTFEQVLHGKLIYKDIWWVYGPLMPYYYGLFYLIFGFKITSILLGKFILNILGGVFFYLAAGVLMPASWAFLASYYFLQTQQDFFFTYNHIGALTLTLAVFWLLLRYIDEKKLRLGFWALACCFIIGLIKINFGITALMVTLLGIATSDMTKKKSFYVCGILMVPVLWLALYGFLLKDLTSYEVHQCLAYFGDDQPHHRTPWETIPYYLMQHWLTFDHHWLNLKNLIPPLLRRPSVFLNPLVLWISVVVILNFLTHPIIHGSTVAGFVLSFSKKFNEHRRKFWLAQMILWSFFVLNFHEFVVSGVWYRTFWSMPFGLFFSFLMISTAVAFAPRWLRYTIGGIWIGLLTIWTIIAFVVLKNSCTPDKFLNMPRGQIYVGNEKAWVNTVNTVTAYLNQNLQKDELFFALPYDCLYYYLTARPSPTRQLIFFDHIKIPPQQEISVIRELEKNKVNYILVSNRIASHEIGLGVFGKTYCPLLYQYILQNFRPIYHYGGNWQAEPGWANNHGVIIFKRSLVTKNPEHDSGLRFSDTYVP